jgi:hypothetical protein
MEVSSPCRNLSQEVDIGSCRVNVLWALDVRHLIRGIIHSSLQEQDEVEAEDQHEEDENDVDEQTDQLCAVGHSKVLPQQKLGLHTPGNLKPVAFEHLGSLFLRLEALEETEEPALCPRLAVGVDTSLHALHRPEEDKGCNSLVVMAHQLQIFEVLLLERLNLL